MKKNTTFHMIYRLSLCEMYYRCYSLICYSRDETPYQSLSYCVKKKTKMTPLKPSVLLIKSLIV